MLQELVIQHREKKEKRYVLLNKPSYRIGKALDNDIVLLDSDALPYLGTLEKEGSKYLWKNDHISSGYSFHIRNHQKSISAVFFAMIFCASLLFFKSFYASESKNSGALKLPARGSYGNMDPLSPISNVMFEFQTQKGKFPVLHYTPGNLSSADDLRINVNSHFVGFAPASPGRWNVEASKYILQELLNEGQNTLEFSFHGKKTDSWAVRDIYIEELDEMPVQQTGEDFFKSAQKLLRERGVRKGNLVRAQQVLKRALETYRQQNQNPPPSLEKFSARVQKEKESMIQDHQSLIQKYRREKEFKKSDQVFQRLMDELIDPMDADRVRIEQEVR